MKERRFLEDSLHSLLVFHEVVRQKSFSKAAEELFISQPAVTKHIKGLEDQLGFVLIHRGRGEFKLTEEGKTLLREARRIVNLLRGAEDRLEKLQKERQGSLKIGTSESYSKCLMPELLSAFQNGYPFIKISLDVGNSEEIERSLTNYRNDLALIAVTKTSLRFVSIPFLKEELVLIVSPFHELACKDRISIREIQRFPFIIRAKGSTTRKVLLEAFKKSRIQPSLLIEAGSSEFIKQWVSEGKGISIIVKRIVEEEVRKGILQMISLEDPLTLQVALLYLKEERANPVIRAFSRFIQEKRKEWIIKE
ncbi:MAG: LysR family transcriptional regulator [Thermodesulfobacteriota bacterium]